MHTVGIEASRYIRLATGSMLSHAFILVGLKNFLKVIVIFSIRNYDSVL